MVIGGRSRPNVVCLLPARNAADLLPAWFESVARFADAVVALDDGSTDETAALLDGQPLVRTLLRNPVRAGFAGWDDSANRNRLLAAAAALAPDWIISIDADELVPAESGRRLRRFIDEQAVRGIAYGFPLYRMIGDTEHHDGLTSRIYRLFAYDRRHVFANDRLHFVPVPTVIPRGRWLATDIRVQHLCEMTPERREQRRRKYADVDPGRVWTADYHYDESPPGTVRPWQAVDADDPVVLETHFRDWTLVEADLDWPTLSVVLVADDDNVDDVVGLHDVVAASDRTTTEVIVVALDRELADDVARLRPGANVLVGPGGFTPVHARNAGLRVARGDYVLFLDGPTDVRPSALAALVAIHDRGNAMVAFPSENAVPSAAGWASYFGGGERFSFAREALMRIHGFDERVRDGFERVARDQLLELGQRVGRTPLVVARHRVGIATPAEYLRDRLAAGRIAAHGGQALAELARVDLDALRRAQADSDARPDERDAFRRVRRLLLAGMGARWGGAAWERVVQRAHGGGGPS